MQILKHLVVGLATASVAACEAPEPAQPATAPETTLTTTGTANLSGRYESGNPWDVVFEAGVATYKDVGSSTRWLTQVKDEGRTIVLILPDNYSFDGVRLPNASLKLIFNDAGQCEKMLYISHVPLEGTKEFPATCSGTRPAAAS